MKQALFLSLLAVAYLLAAYPGKCQADDVGSGRALQFNGPNDYVEFGDIYHDVTFPISISAWVFLTSSTGGAAPIFVSNNNTDFTYRGFWLVMSTDWLYFQIGDGLGGK